MYRPHPSSHIDDDDHDDPVLSQWERHVHPSFHEPSSASPAYYPRSLTLGQRVADRISSIMGSWTFVLTQSFSLLLWIMLNILLPSPYDPYPFILLNLTLSFQAAYTAPILMMTNNRQAEVDRGRQSDLHEKVDHIRHQQMWSVWEKVVDMEGEQEKNRDVVKEIRDTMKQLVDKINRIEKRLEHLSGQPNTHSEGAVDDTKDPLND
jgi:uncharacterized membrane protein